MIGELPYSLNIDGADYAINTDYRDAFDIFEAFNAPDLSPYNKQLAMLDILFGEFLPPNIDEAARQAVWFLDGGDTPKSESPPIKTMDYKQDAPLLFSAVNKVAGFEVRNPEINIHWWTFLGYCAEISPDSPISAIVQIRHKRAKGEKLDKSEQKYYRENRHLIDLRGSADDYNEMMRILRGE